MMTRLDKKCLKFEGYEQRNYMKSIYNRDPLVPNDPYDLEKVDLGKLKTTKNSGKSAHVALKKQTDRNPVKMYQSTVGEQYANIKRENEKADYIKKLLMSAD